MTYSAHIKNGNVVLDEPIHLPEGAKVTVDIPAIPSNSKNRPPRDLSALDRLAGKVDLDYEAIDDLRRRSVA